MIDHQYWYCGDENDDALVRPATPVGGFARALVVDTPYGPMIAGNMRGERGETERGKGSAR